VLGYVLGTVDVSVLRRGALIYSLFILLMYLLMYFVNKSWKWVSARHGHKYSLRKGNKEHRHGASINESMPYNPMLAGSLQSQEVLASDIEAAQLDPYSIFVLQHERTLRRQRQQDMLS
jgi:hypothetical protein